MSFIRNLSPAIVSLRVASAPTLVTAATYSRYTPLHQTFTLSTLSRSHLPLLIQQTSATSPSSCVDLMGSRRPLSVSRVCEVECSFDKTILQRFYRNDKKYDPQMYANFFKFMSDCAVDQDKFYHLMKNFAACDEKGTKDVFCEIFLTFFYKEYQRYQLVDLVKDEDKRVDIICRFIKYAPDNCYIELSKLKVRTRNLIKIVEYCFEVKKDNFIVGIVEALKLNDTVSLRDVIFIDKYIDKYPLFFARIFDRLNYDNADREKYASVVFTWAARDCLHYFSNFKLENQKFIKTLVEGLTKCYPVTCINMFDEFNLTDQSARVEIVKMLARQEPVKCTMYFEKFELTDQSVIMEIVEILVPRTPKDCLIFVKNFKLTDEPSILKIAALIAYHWDDRYRDSSNFTVDNVCDYIRDAKMKGHELADWINIFNLAKA